MLGNFRHKSSPASACFQKWKSLVQLIFSLQISGHDLQHLTSALTDHQFPLEFIECPQTNDTVSVSVIEW